MQNRMPRRQQILSQSLEPVTKNRFTAIRQSSISTDEFLIDDTPARSLDSINEINDSVHITD